MGYEPSEEDEFRDYLKYLIDMGHLEGTALGITKLVIDKGMDALSDKQSYVFKAEVLDHYTVEHCSLCGSEVPWSEMYEAATGNGLCNYCKHKMEKDD